VLDAYALFSPKYLKSQENPRVGAYAPSASLTFFGE